MSARIQVDDRLIDFGISLLERGHTRLVAAGDVSELLNLLAYKRPLIHLFHLQDVGRLILAF